EARRDLGQLGLDRGEALLGGALQADAAQLRVAHQRRDDAALRAVERRPGVACLDLLQRAVDRLALAEPDREGGHLGLDGLVRLAERVAVAHAHQVTHRPPGERQAIGHARDRLDDRVPRGRRARLQPIELDAQVREQHTHRRNHVLGRDAIEAGRSGGVQHRRPFGGGHDGVLVDAHVHLLPDRLAHAIRRFLVERMPDYEGYPCELAPARAAIAAAGVTRCWSLPYAHKPGLAHDLNRWMGETFADDAMVVPGATVHPADDVAREVAEALDVLRL